MSLLNHLVIIKMDRKLREVSVPRPNCVCLTMLTSRTWHHASSTYRAVLPRFILHLLWKYGLKITLQYTIYISMYQNLLKGKILYLISCRPPSHTSIMSFWESSYDVFWVSSVTTGTRIWFFIRLYSDMFVILPSRLRSSSSAVLGFLLVKFCCII